MSPADKLTVQFPEIKQVHSLPTKPAENMKNPNLGPTEPQKGMAQHTALGPAPSPEETASELCAPKWNPGHRSSCSELGTGCQRGSTSGKMVEVSMPCWDTLHWRFLCDTAQGDAWQDSSFRASLTTEGQVGYLDSCLVPNHSLAPWIHTSPCVRKLAMRAPFTAFSREQSEKMIRGDLPPSSKVTGLIPLAAISMI